MKKYFSRIKKFYRNLDNLEKKIFWGTAPIITLVSFISFFINIIEKLGTLQVVASLVTAILSLIIIVICKYTEKYTFCYSAISVLLTCVMLPVMYFTNGGMFSGMPLICVACIAAPCFIFDRNKRIPISIISVFLIAAAMILELLHPEFVIPLNDGDAAIRVDMIVCYLMATLPMIIMIDILLEEFKYYTLSRSLLDQYMDVKLQHEIIKDQNGNVLTDAPGKKYMTTILFADISSFTSITEGMVPEQSAEFLNTFLSIADKCVHDNNGILDKYMGDCVMCFWLDSDENGSGVIEACRTVLDIRNTLYEMSETIFKKFGCELDFAAGINYGQAVVGGIGSPNHKDYTVIGDAVNTAQRLQDIATRGKTYVSKSVQKILGPDADIEIVSDKVRLKGKARAVEVFQFNGFTKAMPKEQFPYTIRKTWTKDTSGYIFHVCGCRGSYAISGDIYSEFGGETSCYVIKKDNYAMVIDCGTGLYKARSILADCEHIDILLTHVHYDHVLGLLDWSVFPQNAELCFYGEFDQWEGPQTISNMVRPPFWPVDLIRGDFVTIQKKKRYNLSDDLNITFFDSDHPNHCSIIVINISDVKVCIMADCENNQIAPLAEIRGCDLLLYDAMYERKDYQKHIGWGHSTWEDGVDFANKIHPNMLMITHHDPRSSDSVLREHERQAKAIFPATVFARSGDKISL